MKRRSFRGHTARGMRSSNNWDKKAFNMSVLTKRLAHTNGESLLHPRIYCDFSLSKRDVILQGFSHLDPLAARLVPMGHLGGKMILSSTMLNGAR